MLKTLKTCLPIYLKATTAYQDAVNEGKININTPLSFNQLATKQEITKIVTAIDKQDDINIIISQNGYASVNDNVLIKSTSPI